MRRPVKSPVYNRINERSRQDTYMALDTLWRFHGSVSDCVQAMVAGDCFLRGVLPVDGCPVSRQISFRREAYALVNAQALESTESELMPSGGPQTTPSESSGAASF
jgi:hypothetical protein